MIFPDLKGKASNQFEWPPDEKEYPTRSLKDWQRAARSVSGIDGNQFDGKPTISD